MYTFKNYRTKSALKADVKAGVPVPTFAPGLAKYVTTDGEATLEGPHAPEPHKWYARVLLRSGNVIKVIS